MICSCRSGPWRQRRLLAGDELVAEIRYPDAATTEFEQRRDGYRLTIRTLQGEGARP